jgi:hypothetical protein
MSQARAEKMAGCSHPVDEVLSGACNLQVTARADLHAGIVAVLLILAVAIGLPEE